MRDCRLLFRLKLDADPVLLDPNNSTGPNDPISLGHQLEAIRDKRGVGNIQGRTVIGHICNSAARARARCRNVGHFVNVGPQGLSALVDHRGHSAERHAKARSLPPYHGAGIDFRFSNNDQSELIGDKTLGSRVQRSADFRKIADNAGDGKVAEPDQTAIEDFAARSGACFRIRYCDAIGPPVKTDC